MCRQLESILFPISLAIYDGNYNGLFFIGIFFSSDIIWNECVQLADYIFAIYVARWLVSWFA